MTTGYPRGAFNAHLFSVFNAVSFQVIMGTPIILYAKSLGASSSVLGLIASFTPLMTVLQIPAAHYLGRYRFRDFVMMGWGLRTVLIYVLVLIPLASFLEASGKVLAVLVLLFFFNFLRGISSAAWMPWIAALIPEGVRGVFISRDQIAVHLGCLVSLVVSAEMLSGDAETWEYSLVFLMSAVAATLSLFFIMKIPEPYSLEQVRRGAEPVPWGAMVRFPPFLRLLIFNILYLVVTGSLGVFTVEFLREERGLDVSGILWLTTIGFIGALVTFPWCGVAVDRVGSKPLVRLATLGFGLVIGGWFLLAGVFRGVDVWVVAVLNFASGVASAFFHVANSRVVMGTMPEMGRNHFFALFTVMSSFALGASPVMWGMFLDFLGALEFVTGLVTWRRHSIYFLVLFAINVAAFWRAGRLFEPDDARRFDGDVLDLSLRRSQRFWQR